MASDVAITPVLDHPLQVRPDEVEAALDQLWRECAPANSDESTIRLRLLNFVVLGAEDDADGRFQGVMAALPARHPCRGILAMTLAGERSVAASIGARCWLVSGGGRHLCSEEITLTAAPGEERALASAVLALLVPEVGVTVWAMHGLPPAPALLDEVADAADQLYFDSAEAPDPISCWERGVSVASGCDLVLRDLAWQRTAAWRALVSQLFDYEDARAELRQLTSIVLGSGGSQPSAEALLMAGWLVSRLGITIADTSGVGSDGLTATLYDGSRGVRLAIAPAGDVPVRSIELCTEHATFTIDLDRGRGNMHVAETIAGRQSRRTVAYPADDDASLFVAALDGGDEPSVYSDAVDAALSLLGRQPLAVTGTPRSPA